MSMYSLPHIQGGKVDLDLPTSMYKMPIIQGEATDQENKETEVRADIVVEIA